MLFAGRRAFAVPMISILRNLSKLLSSGSVLRYSSVCWLVVLCSSGEVEAQYFPGADGEWETVSREESGVDGAMLDEAIAFAGETNSNALVILYKGRVLEEAYWGGWDRNTRGPSYSSAKSVASVLVGQSIERGLIEGLDQPTSAFLEEWEGDAERKEILIRHHLSMTTGFEESRLTLLLLHAARDERRFGTNQEVPYEPGTRWYYNDAAYRLLFYVLEEASGESLEAFSRASLFDKIGMEQTDWVVREETVLGQVIENYEWLEYTALDAARFGLLAMNKGSWSGEQVVSQEWMEASVEPQYEFAPWYGRLWWLNGSDHHRLPSDDERREGAFAPDAPPDMFGALGAFDQKTYVVPSLDLVVVRLGDSASEDSLAAGVYDNLLLGRICRAFGYEGQTERLDLEWARSEDSLSLHFDTWNGRNYRVWESQDLEEWNPANGYETISGNGLSGQLEVDVSREIFYRIQSRFGM